MFRGRPFRVDRSSPCRNPSKNTRRQPYCIAAASFLPAIATLSSRASAVSGSRARGAPAPRGSVARRRVPISESRSWWAMLRRAFARLHVAMGARRCRRSGQPTREPRPGREHTGSLKSVAGPEAAPDSTPGDTDEPCARSVDAAPTVESAHGKPPPDPPVHRATSRSWLQGLAPPTSWRSREHREVISATPVLPWALSPSRSLRAYTRHAPRPKARAPIRPYERDPSAVRHHMPKHASAPVREDGATLRAAAQRGAAGVCPEPR